MKKYSVFLLSLICLIFVAFSAPYSCAQAIDTPVAEEKEKKKEKNDKWTNIIYFTGIGCPHCANTDPVILKSRLRKGDVMVFEYEIYRDNVNGPLLMEYNKLYGASLAVPQIIVTGDSSGIVSGDSPILDSLETLIALHKGNDVLLATGAVGFDELSFVKLPLKPKIWFKNRLAVREDSTSLQNESIKDFLLNGNIPEKCKPEGKASAPLSGGKIKFKNSCRFNGWVLMHD